MIVLKFPVPHFGVLNQEYCREGFASHFSVLYLRYSLLLQPTVAVVRVDLYWLWALPLARHTCRPPSPLAVHRNGGDEKVEECVIQELPLARASFTALRGECNCSTVVAALLG